jgi:MarR family 2-MHQ and catechol resistance regulon transcriptional repressor
METASGESAAAGEARLGFNLDEEARYAVMNAGARLFKGADPFYRALGLTGVQYNVLRVLEAAEESLSQQEIARRILASRANVTNLIDQLEAKGLIRRGPCEDRRVKRVSLTPEAEALLVSSYADVLEINADMMENLTTEEKETLLALIRKLGSGSQAWRRRSF